MGDDELQESLRNVAGKHHGFGRSAKDSDTVLGNTDAGVLVF